MMTTATLIDRETNGFRVRVQVDRFYSTPDYTVLLDASTTIGRTMIIGCWYRDRSGELVDNQIGGSMVVSRGFVEEAEEILAATIRIQPPATLAAVV